MERLAAWPQLWGNTENQGDSMRKSMFALAAFAVALPSYAIAGEPVKLSDSDLDVITGAGLSTAQINQAIAQIRAHPAEFQARVLRNESLFRQNESEVRRLLPSDLHYLLPSSD